MVSGLVKRGTGIDSSIVSFSSNGRMEEKVGGKES